MTGTAFEIGAIITALPLFSKSSLMNMHYLIIKGRKDLEMSMVKR